MKRYYPDAAIHLGDGIDDLLTLSTDFPLTNFFYVKGDLDDSGNLNRLQTFENVSIFITHNGQYFKIQDDRKKID